MKAHLITHVVRIGMRSLTLTDIVQTIRLMFVLLPIGQGGLGGSLILACYPLSR